MKVIFMGTPEFAVASLASIISRHEVLAIVTSTDKLAGRGHSIQTSAVKKYALDHAFPILQPKNLKGIKFCETLIKFNADIFIVVAFRMLPEIVWSIPRYGTINLHASLLPKYRGAAPIQRAIMNGEKESGLTVFKLNSQIDTGDIISQLAIPIGEDETGGEVHDKMMIKGGEIILKSMELLEKNQKNIIPQNNDQSSSAPKLFRNDCEIFWNQDVSKVYNHIRALIPYPGPWFQYGSQTYKIYACRKVNSKPSALPGHFVIEDSKLFIACLNGFINVLEIQQNGKRRMKIDEFLRGFKSIS